MATTPLSTLLSRRDLIGRAAAGFTVPASAGSLREVFDAIGGWVDRRAAGNGSMA